MESVYRGPQIWRWMLLAGTVTGWALTAQAVYQPSQLPDPSRRWSATLSLRQGYDDNINATEDDKESSSTTIIEPRLYLNIPLDQSYFGLRYTYNATAYWEREDEEFDQAHIADLLFSHRFNPRLTLNIDNSLRRGVEPELVDYVGLVPQIQRQEGDFWFNALSVGMTWNASRRWLLSLSQGWQFWSYDQESIAADSDRHSLSTAAVSTYTLDPVSTIALNFRYGLTLYDNAGPSDERDSRTETVFVSYTRLFNPQFTAQIAGGAGFTQFGNDDDDVSPYGSVSFAYTYAPESSLSLNSTYSFSASDAGVYRSSDALVTTLQLSQRVTRKLRLGAGVDYIRRSYQNPDSSLLISSEEPEEDAVRGRLAASYLVNRWLSLDFSYTYERVWSDLSGREYDRNRVNGGVRFTF